MRIRFPGVTSAPAWLRFHGITVRFVCSGVGLSSLAVLAVAPQGLTAQASTQSFTPLPPALASITTDTGAFAPGHQNFSDYTVPGLCAAAAATTAEVLRNPLPARQAYDTLNQMPDKDTLPPKARQVARACGAAFTLQNTDSLQWPSLFDLAVMSGNDSLARTVVARRLETTATPQGRQAIERATVSAYLGQPADGLHPAQPARPDLAAMLESQWDQQMSPSGPVDVKALAQAVQWHSNLLQYGAQIHDEALVDRELQKISALAHTLTVPSTTMAAVGGALYAGYVAKMRFAYLASPDSMRPVAVQAQHDLQRFSSDSICPQGWGGTSTACRAASVDTVEAWLTRPLGYTTNAQTWRVHADYWFPPKGQPADTVFPTPGKVTLVVHQILMCSLDEEWIVYFGCGSEELDAIRQYVHRYGAQGLQVVMVSSTHGWAYLSGALTPRQEAERIRWYYQDFFGLPVTVAVQIPRPEVKIADGRRWFGTWDPGQNWYIDSTLFQFQRWQDLGYYSGGIILVGQNGQTLAQRGSGNNNVPLLDEDIQHALRLPPSQLTSSPSAQ